MQDSIKKLYYSITEAAKIVSEEQHVLRYWEREFSQLRPQKNRAGNRIYSGRDMAVLMLIRKLLREERYTVAGAKEFLRQNGLPEDLQFSAPEGPAPIVAEHDVPGGLENGAEPTAESSASQGEILRLIHEIRAFSAEIRAKTGKNTPE
jgi:DNA-binding transcriptional MerR regulator